MSNLPLAEQLRPQQISDFEGQEHLTGSNGIITKLIIASKEKSYFPSIILWGPPGCGKTSLARLISKELNRKFFEFSAVNTSVKEIEKQVITSLPSHTTHTYVSTVQQNLGFNDTHEKYAQGSPVVFIDEIHRFNKAQQDALLPHVEHGSITFIGATTENPSFEVIGPLLSRTRVIILKPLDSTALGKLVDKAVLHIGKTINEDAREFTIEASNGDARVLLNLVEISANLESTPQITIDNLKQALQKSNLNFDLHGEEFYNTISALHKSIRGSDPDAALYYLTRMLEAGQDPLYIARRLIRAASEDIGLADPQALVLAIAAFEACDKIGVPECNLALAEIVVYLAKSPKSNKLYLAYGKAAEDVNTYGNLPIPLHIRNAVTKLMKDVGYGKDYDYSHNPEGKKNPTIDYLPDKIKSHKYI
jgi:putative ATPase